MADPFIGEIRMFGGTFPPRGWAQCDGQLLSISAYSSLFSILGTIYGGDGRTTFGLPRMRGRVPVHMGNGAGLPNFKEGTAGGSTTVTLNTTEIPSHTHSATVTQPTFNVTGSVTPKGHTGLGAKSSSPENNYPATLNDAYSATSTVNMGIAEVNLEATPDEAAAVTNVHTGGNGNHNNMQPYMVVNFIIALVGIYPSRN